MARFYAKVGLGLQSLIEAKIDHLVGKWDMERSTTTTNTTTHE